MNNRKESMKEYSRKLALTLAHSGALFFDDNLTLKDGRPTPYFINFGMFRTGKLAVEMGSFFADMMVEFDLHSKIDVVLGPSYKGSAIAVGTAISLFSKYGKDIMFEYNRKETKSHGEASTKSTHFVNGSFFDGCHIFIVDDVATSMKTKYELLELIEQEARLKGISVEVMGVGIAVDREQTTAVYNEDGTVVLDKKGENAIERFKEETGIPVFTIVGVREMMDFLFHERVPIMIKGERRPMDQDIKEKFDRYMITYGV